MIDSILKGFGSVVMFFYNLCGESYLLALILFAILVKICMLPLSIKQQKNQIKQATLRPKEMAIRKKYAGRNDQPTQQKMQNEIMDLYTRENYNPMGGCLPLLIQLPILLGLYQVITRPLEYLYRVPAKFINETIKTSDALKEIVSKTLTEGQNVEKVINKMSQIELVDVIKNNFDKFSSMVSDYFKTKSDLPNFNLGKINLANIPSLNDFSKEGLILLLVPVLTFVFMFFSMKINKKFTYNAAEGTAQDMNAGCSGKMMDYMMPLMSVYITFIVPAVIGVYWIANNIIGTIQQVILAKAMPIPKFTEEDYKKAEKELNGKSKSSKKKTDGEKKKVRSLHRIDEEDYVSENTPTLEKKKTEEKKGLASMIEKTEVKTDEEEK